MKQTNDLSWIPEMCFVFEGTHIELQFIERPWDYTSGTFWLPTYEGLLIETHQSIVTSPFCGIDRWMDNHYGFSSWNTPGYFERVLDKLTEKGMKYRIYKSLIEHASDGSKNKLEDYNKTEAYMTFIWEPTGQIIQMGGDIDDEQFTNQIPVWSAQWCHRDCGNHLAEGRVDRKHIYVDLEDYDIRMSYGGEAFVCRTGTCTGSGWVAMEGSENE